MQQLYQARDRIEAQFLCDFLDRNLIRACIQGDYLSGAAGELPANIYPSVWILDNEDLPRGHELLARFLAEQSHLVDDPWQCGHCGEQMEGNFEICWNCGRTRTA